MADIELVIKIPEETVNEVKNNAMFAGTIPSEILWDVASAIVNGTPLPKGHGRLIDADELIEGKVANDWTRIQAECAPTIIEADKAEGEVEE